jgi:hypothetical protein
LKLIPVLLVEKAACRDTFWMPPGKPPAGTGTAIPSKNVWTAELFTFDVGTIVDHRLIVESQVVLAEVAVEENVITALGTDIGGWG